MSGAVCSTKRCADGLGIRVSADGLRPQVEAGFLAWGNAIQPGVFSLGSQDRAQALVMGNSCPLCYFSAWPRSQSPFPCFHHLE